MSLRIVLERTQHSILGCALLLFFLTVAANPAWAWSAPDLSGKWRLNRELSEDAKQKLENALRTSSAVTPHDSNIVSDGNRVDNEREQTRRRIEALIEASEAIEIAQGKKEVTISEGHLRERKVYTDGRPYQRPDRQGNLTTIRARWQGDALVLQTRLADGGRFSESYELANGGRQLYVTVTSSDPRLKQPLVIRRVYDAVNEPSE